MSPTKRVGGAADLVAPGVAVDGQVKPDPHHWEEKSAAPLATIEQMLVMLSDLSETMNRMEVSQRQQGRCELTGAQGGCSGEGGRSRDQPSGVGSYSSESVTKRVASDILRYAATSSGRC